MRNSDPERMCCVCRASKPKSRLLRLMMLGGTLRLDAAGKGGGRGLYVCRDEGCITRLKRARRWRAAVGPALEKEMYRELEAEGKPDE